MNRLEERVADQETEKTVEIIARAICKDMGENPDTATPYNAHVDFLWQFYIRGAKAALSALESQGLKIVTEDQLKDTMAKGWNACRTSVYALSENTLERISEDPTAVQRGMKTEAKRFARSLLSMEAEDDNNFTEAYAAMLNAVEG
jgi:hypothetical protein